ncbi:MAG TPA: hypothetical protein PK909_04680, partial [Sphaerochaeta sp.]|nr:hypothetical protein [Sphaerochaeta sp.]
MQQYECNLCGYIYDPEFPPTIGNLRDCIRCGSAVEASSESNLCDECTRDVGAPAFNKEDIKVEYLLAPTEIKQ